MAVTFNQDLLGTFTLVQGDNEFKIEIRRGNCLAVMVYDAGDYWGLFNFWADEQHIKNIIKNSTSAQPLFLGQAKDIRLNLKYKESAKILKYIVKETEVTCYYE